MQDEGRTGARVIEDESQPLSVAREMGIDGAWEIEDESEGGSPPVTQPAAGPRPRWMFIVAIGLPLLGLLGLLSLLSSDGCAVAAESATDPSGSTEGCDSGETPETAGGTVVSDGTTTTSPSSETTTTRAPATTTAPTTTAAPPPPPPPPTAPPVASHRDILWADVAAPQWAAFSAPRAGCDGFNNCEPPEAYRDIWFSVACGQPSSCELSLYGYPPVVLAFDGATYVATGANPSDAYVCSGRPMPSTYELSFQTQAAEFRDGRWVANRVSGALRLAAPATPECRAGSETYHFEAVRR